MPQRASQRKFGKSLKLHLAKQKKQKLEETWTDALISTDQPHNCNIDEAPQNSSSQNLTRKVKDWQDWTYTDGMLQKNKEGQDTGSGVYHPHLNVSHYVNPKGMGITNTISREELAAIASASYTATHI